MSDTAPRYRTASKCNITEAEFREAADAYLEGLEQGCNKFGERIGTAKSAVTYAAESLGMGRSGITRRLFWASHFGVLLPGINDDDDQPELSDLKVPEPEVFHANHKARENLIIDPDKLAAGIVDTAKSMADLAARQATGYKPGVTMPVLPDLEADLESEIAAQIAEFKRSQDAKAARNWMRFEVEGDQPFALAYVGDPHLDDPNTDIALLKEHLDIIEATPRMWAVGMGDYVNGWIGRLERKYADQAVTQRGAYARAKWLFSKKLWLMLIRGNHDAWKGGGSPLDWMMDGSPVPTEEWESRFTVSCGGREWRIWAAHNFPGTSQWNILHGPLKRAMMTGGTADLFICGDHHCYGTLHTQHEHSGKSYWIGRSRGYKMQDDYAKQLGHGNMDIGHTIVAVHDPRDGSMQCFDSVKIAAQYLRFLQERR